MLDKKPGYIIIAEDDAGHTAAISRALGVQMPACRLEFVSCLRDFRAVAARHSPDIALLDLNLRDGCAIEVLSAPAENGAYPVLIMTSHGSEQSAVTALKSGALDYVIKTPESLADIGRAIERVLQQWQLLQERQRSVEEIKQREIRFRALAENAPDIIARLDTECRYIYVNDIVKKKWGIPPSAYVGHSNAEIGMPHEIGALLDRTVRAVIKSGQENTATFRYERKNEAPKYFHSLIVPELDEQGRVSTILSITRDITNQRIVEETLRESEVKYRTLVESAGEAISVTEGERIIFCNSAMSRLMELTMSQLASTSLQDIIYADDLAAFVSWQATASGESRKSPPLRVIRPSGITRWVELTMTNIEWEGKKTARLYFISDITERKLMDEETQRLVKIESISLLAGGIAHDFNNILMAILGNITLAKKHVSGDNEAMIILTEAENASIRAKGLTRQLLAFTKGASSIRHILALPRLLQDTTNLALRGSNVSASYHFAPDLKCLEGDEDQLSQVISNLVINAKQAMTAGGHLEVLADNITTSDLPSKFKNRSDSPSALVRLIFKDNGTGIPAENLKRIFDPFFTTKREGNGLGLASTLSIVQGHNGYIDVDSEVGRGTSFIIYLPAVDGPFAKKVVPAIIEESFIAPKRVLVMDDEASIRDIACRLLKHIGVEEAIAVPDGAAAVALYRVALQEKRPFSAVILDRTVPGGMGGLDTLLKLKEIDGQVKAILSSGYSGHTTADQYQEEGFSGVIDKPYTLAQLRQILAQVTGMTKQP